MSCVQFAAFMRRKKLSLTSPTRLHQQHKRSINTDKQQESAASGTLAQTGWSTRVSSIRRANGPARGREDSFHFVHRARGENQTLIEATGQGCSSSSPRNPAKVLPSSEAFIHFKGPTRLTVSVGEASEGAGELSLAALNLQLLFISSPALLPSFVLCNFSPPLSSSLLDLSSSPLSPFFSASSSSSSPLSFYFLVFYQFFFSSPLHCCFRFLSSPSFSPAFLLSVVGFIERDHLPLSLSALF